MTDDTQARGLIEGLKWSKKDASGATLTEDEVVALLAYIERLEAVEVWRGKQEDAE